MEMLSIRDSAKGLLVEKLQEKLLRNDRICLATSILGVICAVFAVSYSNMVMRIINVCSEFYFRVSFTFGEIQVAGKIGMKITGQSTS